MDCISCSCSNSDKSDGSTSSGEVKCSIFNCSGSDLVKSGFYRTKTFNELVCCGCGWQTGDIKLGDVNLTVRHLNFVHKLLNPDCPMSKHVVEDYHKYYQYLENVIKTENMMRETYLFWPKAYPAIDDMVKSGLYYTGSGDSVCCINCGIVLHDWQPKDQPNVEHVKHAPLCPLMKIIYKYLSDEVDK